MRWSFKFAKLWGTELWVHFTFLLLLAWIGWSGFQQAGLAGALYGVVFILLVFLCVVLHEFGHIFAARRYGIDTPDITLLPIGGVANLERMPEKPVQELVVAVAGPLVNVAIALALIVVLGASFELNDVQELQRISGSLTGRLLLVNIMLVLFNMIPAFPLDGGRVLRALLAMRFDRATATRYAARVGQIFAVLFALAGLFGNPFLLLIAVFIFFAAESESGHETMRAAATGYRARDAMITRYETLGAQSTADHAGRLLLLTTQQEFPVVGDNGAILGMVTRSGLIDAMRETGPTTPVTEFMVGDLPMVPESMPLEAVMQVMSQSPAKAVAIGDGSGRFLGYVSMENAGELFMLASARKGRGRGLG